MTTTSPTKAGSPRSRNPLKRFFIDPQIRFIVLVCVIAIDLFISAFAALEMSSGVSRDHPAVLLTLLFPAVLLLTFLPWLVACILAAAALLSLIALADAPRGQRWLAWVRAFTAWIAAVLVLPLVIYGIGLVMSTLSRLLQG